MSVDVFVVLPSRYDEISELNNANMYYAMDRVTSTRKGYLVQQMHCYF